jgi:signal transduction histidine kinase
VTGDRLLGVAGFLAGLAAAAAIAVGGYPVPVDVLVPAVLLNVAVGWSFVGIGLVARRRRPESRSGVLMCAVGFAWLLHTVGAVDAPAAFVVGAVTKTMYLGVLVHLLVTFPTGRTTTVRQRLLVGLGYLLTAPPGALYLALMAPSGGCWSCPVNVVEIQPPSAAPDQETTTVLLVVVLGGIALLVVLLGLLVARWLQAGSARRRELAPAVWGGAAIVTTTVVQYGAAAVGAAASVQAALAWSTESVLIVWPAALLLGLVRARLERAAAGPLLVAFDGGPEQVQAAVAAALHDPTAELAFRDPERGGFVDAHGAPVEPGGGRDVAVIEHGDRPIAVVVHSSPDPDLVAAVVASVGPAVENQRLHAVARAQLAEVTASRRRIVEAADAERRRLERNLHDGAQQRLLSVVLAVRLARNQLRRGSSDDSAALIAEAAAELEIGLEELRDLARGTYPAVLAEAGLGDALRVLAERAPLLVDLTGDTVGRLAAPVELACWFTVSELLTNAAMHAGASRVVVDLRADDRQVVLQVRYDGVGGADPHGSGLRGLADRVASAGGVFTVHSPHGGGTTAIATFPVTPRVVPAPRRG